MTDTFYCFCCAEEHPTCRICKKNHCISYEECENTPKTYEDLAPEFGYGADY